MRAVSLLDVSPYLPENRVPAACYARYTESAEDSAGVMFKARPSRHHVTPDETAADMAECAVAGLIERHGRETFRSVDAIVTNTTLFDDDLPLVA
ncbi:hypothetical protein [Streptomyces altiplanensis]